jgi:serine/threonine protein kinase
VTLYVMLCGYEPFYGETDSELIRANKDALVEFPPDEWKRISSSARDLVTKMMHVDPHKRLSVEQAITHPWIIEHVHQQGNVAASSSATEMPAFDACTIS